MILVRRPTNEEAQFLSYVDYGPCPDCAGFMIKKHLWHHAKTCFLSKNKTENFEEKANASVVHQNNALVASAIHPIVDNNFTVNILNKLLQDEPGTVAKEDNLIKPFGMLQFQKHSNQQNELSCYRLCKP